VACMINHCSKRAQNKGLCGEHNFAEWRRIRDERFKPWQFDQLVIPGLEIEKPVYETG